MRLSLRPLLPGETDWEKLAAVTLPATALLGAGILKLGIPLPPCPMKNLTGCPCCGCGATRATQAILNGHPGEAFYLNPMITAGFLVLALYGAFSVASVLTGKGRRWRPDKLPRHAGTVTRIGAILIFAANWVWVLLHLPESPWRA